MGNKSLKVMEPSQFDYDIRTVYTLHGNINKLNYTACIDMQYVISICMADKVRKQSIIPTVILCHCLLCIITVYFTLLLLKYLA